MSAPAQTPASAPETGSPGRLMHFPITFFATTMGLGGYTLALRAAGGPLGFGTAPYRVMFALTAAVFALIALVYLAKAALHWHAVVAEWHHPVRLAFFPTVSVSILLMANAAMSLSQPAALALWWLGTVLQGVLTLAVISGWIGTRSFQHGHLSPAWFIPAVGNVIVPVAGVQLGFAEISWLFFSAGLIFWVVLLTLVFNRLVFHDPLPGRLQPTLVILIAPPAVAFLAWVRLAGIGPGAVDPFGHILLSLGYVFGALMAVQIPRILRLPFAMPFWALSFPVAALTIASFLYAELTGSDPHLRVATALLAVLSVLILGLVLRTVAGIVRGEICQPE